MQGFNRRRGRIERLYPQVNAILGRPDFWGRYLINTPSCPGISGAEVAAAASRHVGILPIFNHYDCSAVAGYDTGTGYAEEATSAASRLGIPRGSVLVIDIEPPGPWCSGAIDRAFVEGWYDGVSEAGYSAGYYGDGTAPSTFGQAWCAAVGDRPEVATRFTSGRSSHRCWAATRRRDRRSGCRTRLGARETWSRGCTS
jgi:hypothetical protein